MKRGQEEHGDKVRGADDESDDNDDDDDDERRKKQEEREMRGWPKLLVLCP